MVTARKLVNDRYVISARLDVGQVFFVTRKAVVSRPSVSVSAFKRQVTHYFQVDCSVRIITVAYRRNIRRQGRCGRADIGGLQTAVRTAAVVYFQTDNHTADRRVTHNELRTCRVIAHSRGGVQNRTAVRVPSQYRTRRGLADKLNMYFVIRTSRLNNEEIRHRVGGFEERKLFRDRAAAVAREGHAEVADRTVQECVESQSISADRRIVKTAAAVDIEVDNILVDSDADRCGGIFAN